ncbi:MAG TPA: hypothetical protein VJS17_01910 [Pyrinomonadaceae bacterium]|nr:hypothetical protein [Pyrinomonadaceae bacterium]
MKALALLIVSLLIGLTVQQQKTVTKKPAKPSAEEEKRAAELDTFINYAQSVPAEFSADLLLQVVESGAIKDAKRKQDLIVDAFYVAAKAKEPVKLVGLPGSAVDSRNGYRATAFTLGFDAVSLQSRAIKALLLLDQQKARQLFGEIKLQTEPLTCEHSLAYNVSVFFSTIEAVAQSAFNAEEVTRGEHVMFVENYVGKINSSNQIQPAVKAILAIKTTDLELTNLGRAFNTALQKMPADDRSFSAPWNSTSASIDQLVAGFSQRGLASDDIVESYRAYLVRHLGGSRCADNASSKQRKEFEAQLVAHFNDKLRASSYKKIAAISEDEIKSPNSGGGAKDEAFWTSPKSKSLLSRVKKLRFSAAGKELNDQDKQSAEWQSQLSEVVREIAGWSAEDEKTEADYFHQKAVVYYALLKIIPADNDYEGVLDEVLRDFTALLSSSPLQKEKPAEWFIHAKVLIDRANKAAPRESQKLTNLINSSRSTVLSLYLQKQELLKPVAATTAR